MKRYLEVIGEGKYIEMASRFVAEVTIDVRAAKDETVVRELAELWGEAIAILREAQITEEEMVEGGTELHRPWYWKKNVGQNAARKIILKVNELARLNQALEKLEPLQSRNKERKTISVEMRQPEFEDSIDAKSAALVQAFKDAHAKATQLAAAMQCQLGKPINFEEGAWAKRGSGFAGDEDWAGDSGRFAMGGGFAVLAASGGAAAEDEPELQRPTRSIFVKCRVRFSLKSSKP